MAAPLLGCASGPLFGCLVVCPSSGPAPEFVPKSPVLKVGERAFMTFGVPSMKERYVGTWESSAPDVVAVRPWPGKCYTACIEVVAVAVGRASVRLRIEGWRDDMINEVQVE